MKRLINLVAAAAAVCTASSAWLYVPTLAGVVGSQTTTHNGCENCNDREHRFAECFHYNPPGNTSCLTNSCLQNYFAYWECSQAASGNGDCKTTTDATAPIRQQNIRSAANLPCGNVNAPFTVMADFPLRAANNTCIDQTVPSDPNSAFRKGKCRIDPGNMCDTGTVNGVQVFSGLDKCDT